MVNLSEYNREQLETLAMVQKHLQTLPAAARNRLNGNIGEYLSFREEVDQFLETHFSQICTATCYQSRLSACCTREGIITFFADIVINTLRADPPDLAKMVVALTKPGSATKCVYLGDEGCLWTVKPIVCQMFLCDPAMQRVFEHNQKAALEWKALKQQEKTFRWPDRPVLFDALELFFIKAGFKSPLMYLNNSPGLLRLKQNAKKRQPVVK